VALIAGVPASVGTVSWRANLTTAYEHKLIERVNRYQRVQQAASQNAEQEGRERPPRGQARAPTA